MPVSLAIAALARAGAPSVPTPRQGYRPAPAPSSRVIAGFAPEIAPAALAPAIITVSVPIRLP